MSEQKGVEAVERALAILDCFSHTPGPLTLAQLARETGLYKSTILRLIVSLERFGHIERDDTGRYRLGNAAWRLGAQYRAGFSLGTALHRTLEDLVEQTAETASFYIRQGDMRICLYRVEPTRAIRHSVAEGVELPINRGASGKVLQAWSEPYPAEFEATREAGYATSHGERNGEVAAVAAPVFDTAGDLRGAITVSGLVTRFDTQTVEKIAGIVRESAARLLIPA
ncbi:IclR family transcriptional regulator [Martelella alba]|uniref:IclR family transcriptional regulator n=1 Tax=Martelella alba TaxID=2590451 RepID=A0A506UF20_9HYPH|nr:IclR family transcriptional regulator [Martelella alba]TPW31594.1 IclR family transcriptional regulator [Martelella alba]